MGTLPYMVLANFSVSATHFVTFSFIQFLERSGARQHHYELSTAIVCKKICSQEYVKAKAERRSKVISFK